jgi:hypothetical protein
MRAAAGTAVHGGAGALRCTFAPPNWQKRWALGGTDTHLPEDGASFSLFPPLFLDPSNLKSIINNEQQPHDNDYGREKSSLPREMIW